MQYQRIKLWFSNESSKYKKGKMRKNSFFHIKSGGGQNTSMMWQEGRQYIDGSAITILTEVPSLY